MMEPYLCPTSPPHGDGRGTIGGTGIVREVRAIRDAYVLPFSLSLKQVDFLSGLIIIGPGSEHAYFIYSNEDRVEEILSVHRRVPITIQGRTLRIERAENRPYRPSTVYSGDASELEKPLDLGLLVLSSRSSHGRCSGLEVRATHRARSGLVGWLRVSLRQLS